MQLPWSKFSPIVCVKQLLTVYTKKKHSCKVPEFVSSAWSNGIRVKVWESDTAYGFVVKKGEHFVSRHAHTTGSEDLLTQRLIV